MNVKKYMKRLIPIVLLSAGIITSVTGLAMGAKKDYINAMNLTEFEANIPSGNIFNMDINVDIADLKIISSNDVDNFRIEAQNVSKEYLDYSTSNNTFSFMYEIDKWYKNVFIPGFMKKRGTITIYIPAGMSLKDVQINSGRYNTDISYLTAERVFIDFGRGPGSITNLTCDYSKISNTGGDINCLNIDSDDADIYTTSGKAALSNFVSNSLIINNKVGDIDLSGKINGDCVLNSKSGDIKITVYGNESDYKFNVIDGSVSVNGKKNPDNKDAKYNFKVNSGRSDVNINIK